MSPTRLSMSSRTAQVLSTTGLGLLAAALIVSPAAAVAECDTMASDSEDYAAELACASAAEDGEQVITLTGSFSVGSEDANVYDGTQPLTVRGAHADITITGPAVAEQVSGAEGALGSFLTVYGEGSAPAMIPDLDTPAPAPSDGGAQVTIQDVSIEGFQAVGAINNFSTRLLEISDVSLLDSGVLAFGGSTAVSSAGALTISRSHFEGNHGFFGGAVNMRTGVYWQGEMQAPEVMGSATVTIVDSSFTANTAMVGGAILVFGETRVSGSTFTGNTAETGGAIASYGTSTTVTNSTLTSNTAAISPVFDGAFEELAGGAIAVDGSLAVTGSTLSDNFSENVGGAIAFSESFLERDASLALETSTLEDNVAIGAGGAVWFEGGAVITGATFTANESTEGPAAIAVSALDENVTVTNSTFLANSSDAAAPAVAVDGAAGVEVIHATFVANSSTGDAADLGVRGADGTVLTASAWMPYGGAASCDVSGAVSTAANFDTDGSCTSDWAGEGDIGDGLNPQLGTLADNGGLTPTLLPAVDGPLVDAVPAGVSVIGTDQRGVARPHGAAKDIGAVELEYELVSEPDGGLVEFQVETDAGTIAGTASPALAVSDVAWIPANDLVTAPPADTALPYGAAGFTVEVAQPGDDVTISLTAPRPFTTLLKSADGQWTKVDGASFSDGGTTVTYTLTDGGELDEDGEANGFIVDPVALAVQATFTG